MNVTRVLSGLAAAALLSGCAGLSSISADVSSYGDWPAARQPTTYAFERLPSQQAAGNDTDALEAAAAPALAKAGFRPVAAGQEPDVLVQAGARTTRADHGPWDDPLWWRGSFGYWRYGPWLSPRWSISARTDFPRYEREVALLIRDRSSGKPLFEARASNEGNTAYDSTLRSALFEAAMQDFPRLGLNPRRVVVALPQAQK
ncbi:MAG: DUF4136 domain-containing protein [Chitinophagaceae bacterium]|nr:DUF4136 domain-containing protein [Rubrivivax sp.]